MREATRDPDDLYDDATTFLIEIRVRRNGNMSVAGNIADEAYAIACLDQAKDTVRSYHARNRVGQTIIVPGNDLALPS
jgi:hypothetical protein